MELRRLSPCKRPAPTNVINENQNIPVVNPLNIGNQPNGEIPNEVTEEAPDIDIRIKEKETYP